MTENNLEWLPGEVAVEKGEGLVGTAFQQAEMVCWQNMGQSSLARKDAIFQFNWECGLAVPVLYEGEVIAVFNFFSSQPFTQRQLNSKLLQKIQQELGTSLQKIRTETELNNFFELSPDLLIIISRDGYFRKVNAAVLNTIGCKEEDLLPQKSYDLVHPLDKEEFREELQRMLEGASPRYIENRVLTSSNSIRWLGWSFTPVVEEGLIFAVAKDITYNKKLEAEKENILESITDYFYTLDNQFNYTYLNSAAQYLLANNGESLKGKNIWQQYPTLAGSDFSEQMQIAMQEKKPRTFEYFAVEFQTWFEQSVYPTEDGLSVFFRSINDRKATECKLNKLNKSLAKKADELAASNSELERFAYVASHDLQEPLRMISGFMQLLQKRYEPQLDDNGKKYVNFAIDGAVRMKNLIQELLNYSKAGNLETGLEPVDMSEVMADVKMILKTPIANSAAVINSSIMPVVNANITMVTQLMQNLIGNGIKYQLPGNIPIIEVSADKKETHWEFCVKDNGIGIGKEYQDKVFELFHRLHTKQQYAGTGIGLSICKKIVEKLGGDIWVTSEEGKGSRFTFTIPF
jgi:PAS domain S-box-containing protein